MTAASRTKSLDRLLAAAVRRARLADAAWVLGRVALPAAMVIAAAVLLAIRRLGAPPVALWLCALPLPAALAWAGLRPHAIRRVARRLDTHFRLDDQLGAALELSAPRPGADPRTVAIITLVRERADALAQTLDPAAAIGVRVPTPRWTDAVAALAALAAWFVPPVHADPLAPSLSGVAIEPVGRTHAKAGIDLALAAPLRQSLKELTGAKDDPAAAAQEILDILDALERGDIDRAAALERLEELERELADADAELDAALREDPALLAEALDELGNALQQEEVTSEAGDALDRGDGDAAEAALTAAGEEAAADAASDAQMQRALAEAERRLAKQNDARDASETAKQLDEAERRLRGEEKQKPEDPEAKAEHERRLEQQRERVETLARQHERELAAQRKVEELRRNAKQAAQNKAGSAERKRQLEKLGRGMKEASKSARSSQRMQGAQDAVEEAKSFVRRSGQSGAGEDTRRQQFRKFDTAAKGQGQQQGKDGKGNDGKGKSTLLVEGKLGDGEPDGMMEMPGDGQGQDGQGQDGQGQDGESDGDGQGQGQGQGNAASGDGMGDGSQDPLGDPSRMAAGTTDVRVDARRGRGVSKAEILQDASQHGFATEPYRRTYEEYRDHAQSTLDSDAFPSAQRRLVKRYYQMIQGR